MFSQAVRSQTTNNLRDAAPKMRQKPATPESESPAASVTVFFCPPTATRTRPSRGRYSAQHYMQMVGARRGVKNGGTAECRMVTVVDNLDRFQDRHPYHYGRRYFDEVEGKLAPEHRNSPKRRAERLAQNAA